MSTEPPVSTPPADTLPTPPPPVKRRWRRPTRRTVFRAISWTVGALIVLFLILGIWIYRESVGRFQVRRLRLPTRIYADYMPLAPGNALQTDDLLEKLDRLGYRESARLAQPVSPPQNSRPHSSAI